MTTTIWHRSGDRQLKKTAFAAAAGAKVQFYSGGTTTPLTVYTDAAAATPHNAASLVTDANGLWPAVYVPYGAFDYRILDSDDTIIFTATNVPNVAPVDPTSVDANALLTTGDMIFSPAAVTRAGFVRANGNTIGSGASSATERANNDCENLFTWLWNNLANGQAAVSSGRGGTAAADWAANKTIATPDLRASLPIGLDDMGASAASRYGSATFAHGNATTGGSEVGANTVTVAEANLPAHTHGVGTIATASSSAHQHGISGVSVGNAGTHVHSVNDPGHSHTYTARQNTTTATAGGVGVTDSSSASTSTGGATTGVSLAAGGDHSHGLSGSVAADGIHTHSMSGSTASTGSGTALNVLSRAILGTWLLKL